MKTSLVCLMALATVMGITESSNTRVCTPNAPFKLQCNTCSCSSDGTTYACTKMLCPQMKSNERVCIPNSHFKEDCNSCVCSNDGYQKICTRMFCLKERTTEMIKEDKEDLKDNEIPLGELKKKAEQVCEPNSYFKEYCNSCFCSADGTNKACTRMFCDPDIFLKNGSVRIDRVERSKRSVEVEAIKTDREARVCEAGKVFKNYCNTCACAKDGKSYVCTRMYCDQNIFKKDGSLKVEFENDRSKSVCEPNKRFNDYCNTCECSADGLSKACTMMACDKSIFDRDGSLKIEANQPRQICQPNAIFQDYCNYCKCSSDGSRKSCTLMECDRSIFNKDGSIKRSSTLLKKYDHRQEAEKICQPNSLFKDYCNTCKCSSNGTFKTCTLMACDPRIFNPDGSIKEDR